MPTPAFLPNLVDEARFRPRNQWPVHDVAQRRESFGVDADGMLCIIPARLEPVKGLVPFLRALDSASLTGWKIVIMGQGPLKESIRQTICEQGLEDCVRVLDYVPYEEMPLCYAAADLLLLPSVYDPNPLSVIEALHSGLPVAVTDQAGNVEESVSPGGNGWVLPVLDQARYQCCLREVFSCSKATLRCMGGHSKSVEAEFWCTTRSVHRFLEEVLAGN